MSALQQTGAISLIEIANEFGVSSGARSLKAFYRGGSNVSSTTVVTTSATNAPSNNTPVSNFAGVTGLTLSADLTTLSTDSSGRALIYTSSNDSADRTTALNSTYSYEAGDILDVYVRNPVYGLSLGIQANFTSGTISTSTLTRQGDSPGSSTINSANFSVIARALPGGAYTSETSFFTTNITGAGVLDITSISSQFNPVAQYLGARVRVNPGSDGQAVTVVRDDGTLFTNNSAYAVNITGNATNTVQVGGTLTGAFPDSNNQYTCSYTPVSTDQTATPAPPTSDSAVSDFGGVTGLTCTRTSTTTTSSTTLGTQQVIIGKGNPPVTGTNPVTVGNSNSSDFVFKQLIDNEDPSNNSGAVTVTMQGSSGTTRTASLQSNPTGHPVLGNGPYTITNNANTVLRFQYYYTQASSSTTFTYSFTNNTGFSVTISGSGITTTTIPDGGTNNEAIVHPSGNFTVQYQVANAQALNGNIPESGAISLTNFYGTEDFS